MEILAAEQTFETSSWYEGTADAVRKNFLHFRTQNPTQYIILSGDQLYRMNLQEMFSSNRDRCGDHRSRHPVVREKTHAFGILKAEMTCGSPNSSKSRRRPRTSIT